MNEDTDQKHYTDKGMEYEPMLGVGDWIEFDFFGVTKKGRIQTVGKYGYWIDIGSMYNGSIRCPYGKEREIAYT